MDLVAVIVDDDRTFTLLAAEALKREGMEVSVAHSLHEARRAIEQVSPDLVVLDRRLPDGDGHSFLPELRNACPGAAVVMVTAYSDIAGAVESIRAGASDYLAKPVELVDLVNKARRAVEQMRLRDRLRFAEAELLGRRHMVPPSSPRMRVLIEALDRIAAAPRSPVLLLGETGTGKEVLAWYLHARGAGSAAPFVHVNCAALPETTIESELFGHERGAFTDARNARRGLVEVATGGTLFLDEVGELSAPAQAKLLTFLDSGTFRRLGGTNQRTSSARVVAATNRDLEAGVRAGAFREDLWFRLSVFRLQVPPLRDRREDVVPLAEGLLERLGSELGRRGLSLSGLARRRLEAYPFPGNVRELRNVLERALVLEPGPELTLDLLDVPVGGGSEVSATPSESSGAGDSIPLGLPSSPVAGTSTAEGAAFVVSGEPITMEALERRYAAYVLERMGGRRVEAARALGISYPTFLRRIEE